MVLETARRRGASAAPTPGPLWAAQAGSPTQGQLGLGSACGQLSLHRPGCLLHGAEAQQPRHVEPKGVSLSTLPGAAADTAPYPLLPQSVGTFPAALGGPPSLSSETTECTTGHWDPWLSQTCSLVT